MANCQSATVYLLENGGSVGGLRSRRVCALIRKMNPEPPSSSITRREFLGSLPPAAALLVAAHGSARAADGGPAGFSFIQVNDLHYFNDECGPWFRAVVEQMKASAPAAKFCLLCGDLADDGSHAALTAVKAIFSGLGVPLCAVPGNHDFTSGETRTGYDAVFAGMLNYRFVHEGWQFLGLDSTMGTQFDETLVNDATLAWLDAEVPKLDPRAPTVAFTHFPLAEGMTYRPRNAAAALERLLKLNLVAVFNGHWHGADERKAGAATLITSRCCARVRGNRDGSPLKGWYVCDARPDGTLARRFVTFRAPAEIPAAI